MSRRPKQLRGVLLAGAAAVLPVLTFAASAAPPALPASGAFAPPQSPLVLTRTLRRALPGGAELVSRRQYQVRIVPNGDGFSVDGTLVSAEVQVPPMLEALAAIERARPDTGLFPIALDAQGLILPGGPRVVPGAALRRAAAVTASEVDKAVSDSAERQQAQAFVNQVEMQAAGAQWPADLFHPAPGLRRESREVALPGGGEGHVTIEIDGRSGAGGMLSRLERVVTTELGGTTRITREEWTLSRS